MFYVYSLSCIHLFTTVVDVVPVPSKNASKITFSDLELGELIGRGGGGVVCRGKYNSQPVAIKELYGGVDEERLHRQMESFVKLHHTNIIKFYGTATERHKVYMISM